MNRFCLVVLIGLPAVGKTTVCQYLMHMEPLPFNILHLCYDNLIRFISEKPSQYKVQRENVLKLLKTIIHKFKYTKHLPTELHSMKIQYKNYQRNDIVVLCDDNHYYRSMRYKLYQLARENSLGYCQIYFKCTMNLALERNSLRSDLTNIPSNVIIQMNKRLEIPNSTENKWEENTLILQNNSYQSNCNEIILHIMKFLDKPLNPLQIPVLKSTTQQSRVHELDLLMRKRIKVLMSTKQQQNKKLLAKNLNDRRKEILKNYQIAMDNHSVLDLNIFVEMLT